MKSKIKPRNPFVALAKFRKAGSHEKPEKSLRRQENQTLAKTVKQLPESWHKCIPPECSSAMAPEAALLMSFTRYFVRRSFFGRSFLCR